MKLHLTTAEKQNLITGYGDDFIEINRQRFHHNLIVTPEHINADWGCDAFASLTPAHFAEISLTKPEVVLLGSGSTHRFLHPRIYSGLTELGIPLECMNTAAACRTYNILMSEGRNVAAILCLS
ncbi:hypothetical protein Meth11DRAFT_0935 [Methylophilaceae bacterium 11]|nr:hypothetical protein Meth11DRAFT_0935 [Methylophilaceae bacterium 11]